MKKAVLSLSFILVFMVGSFAQKYAYVDTKYILENIPEYNDAQSQLDTLSFQWQKSIESKYKEIDDLYKKYQAEALLLPEDVKKKRENEITNIEKEVKELQKQKFGKEGDLYKKRQELVKPIQDKVFNAIEEIAQQKNYSFVFDKAGSLTILYVDSKLDISEDVLTKIGVTIKPKKVDTNKLAPKVNVKSDDNPKMKTDDKPKQLKQTE